MNKAKIKPDLPERIRAEADISTRPGQYSRLAGMADEIDSFIADMGFCPKDLDSMPCLTCGAGL